MTTNAFDLVAQQPWAILPDVLDTICSIAQRENESVEAVEARFGQPLTNTRNVTIRGNTAVIPVTGPVFRYANLFTQISGATSTDVLATDFTTADDDADIDHIVLVFDTPGGVAAGISELATMIRNSNTPVTAYVDNMAASAGYWLASAANEIVVSKTGSVGSIGAVLTANISKDDNEIEIVSSQSPKKRPDLTTDDGVAQVQEYIDAMAQVFVEDVAANRGVTVDTVLEDFGQGAMKLGEDAVAAGMADRVSTLEEVIAGATGATIGGIMPGENGAPDASTPVINREYLMANHADLVGAFTQEGHAAGASAECERIKAVAAVALIGNHPKLKAELMFDGKTTAPEAALKVLAAEEAKGTEAAADLAADADGLGDIEGGAIADQDTGASDDDTPEAKAEAKWNSDSDLRAEFDDNKDTFMAYVKANEAGLVKILGDK